MLRALLLTICLIGFCSGQQLGAGQRKERQRFRSEKLPRLTYSNFGERLRKLGITEDSEDFPFAEELPFQVQEWMPNYKIVRFPAAKWICSREYRYEHDDPFKGWRKEFNNDGNKATSDNPNIGTANIMFNRLFRYILGVNTELVTIPITVPIVQKRTPEQGKPGPSQFWKHEQCFWAGSDYSSKELPGVLDDKTYIVKTDPFSAYVSRFGGFALADEDWIKARDALLERIGEQGRKQVDGETFYSAAYDSPKKTTDRRNEIWIPIKEDSPVLQNSANTLESTVLRTETDYEYRAYGASSWVCTMREVNPINDKLNTWRRKFDDNPFELFNSDTWENSDFHQMNEKLTAYLYGVNSENKKMEERWPLLVMHKPTTPTTEKRTLCRWLGEEFDLVGSGSMEAPQPIDSDVMIVKKEPHNAFAKTFGGFGLSYSDFTGELQELNKEMDKNDDTTNAEEWARAFYDPLNKISARRNEIIVADVE